MHVKKVYKGLVKLQPLYFRQHDFVSFFVVLTLPSLLIQQ